MIVYLFYIFLGLAIEINALVYLLSKEVSEVAFLFPLFLMIHLLATVIFSFGMYKGALNNHFSSPRNWVFLSFIFCFTFSILGFICLLVSYMFLIKRKWQKSDIFAEYEKYINYDFSPEKRFIDPDNLAESAGAELEISPLVDVMGEKDTLLRRGAINVMDKLPNKDAVRLLKMSLKDPDVEIRFYAASMLSKIETELNDNIVIAKKEAERTPESADAHLSLANSYAEYYESGILDDVTANYYRKLAVNEYYIVLDLEGENIKVLNYLANLEAINKEYDKALSKFKRVCEIEPDNVYANVGIIHVYFETGKIKDAIGYAKNIIDKMPRTKGPMREIIEYWAS